MSSNLLTFGQLYGMLLDNIGKINKPANAQLAQVMTMAQEAGLVAINGVTVVPTFVDASDFKADLSGNSPVVVVPEGRFPELNHYEGGDLLRYE